jgi:hypothetical protein
MVRDPSNVRVTRTRSRDGFATADQIRADSVKPASDCATLQPGPTGSPCLGYLRATATRHSSASTAAAAPPRNRRRRWPLAHTDGDMLSAGSFRAMGFTAARTRRIGRAGSGRFVGLGSSCPLDEVLPERRAGRSTVVAAQGAREGERRPHRLSASKAGIASARNRGTLLGARRPVCSRSDTRDRRLRTSHGLIGSMAQPYAIAGHRGVASSARRRTRVPPSYGAH